MLEPCRHDLPPAPSVLGPAATDEVSDSDDENLVEARVGPGAALGSSTGASPFFCKL
jgi:hypothetical protein